MQRELDVKTYADHIATRSRAKHFGSHRLFTDGRKASAIKESITEIESASRRWVDMIGTFRREKSPRQGFINK